ncbi:pleckstrin likey domain-containing family M member 3, partial [Trifolium medium]|nr:pleckstrin likey domain-containing family M member 3 [Trifolium medium]
SETSSICEADLGLLSEEDPQKHLHVTDGGSEGKGNRYINGDKAGASGDVQLENPELDDSELKFDNFRDSRVDVSSSDASVHVGNVNAKSFENLKPIVLPSNGGMRKTLESCSIMQLQLNFPHGALDGAIEDLELNEFYDEVVQDMEEILLESMDSPAAR